MSKPPIKAMKAVKNWCSKHHYCNNPKTRFECPLGWCRTEIPKEWNIRETSRFKRKSKTESEK